MILTAALFALVALCGAAHYFERRADRKAEAAHQTRCAELRAEQDRAWAGLLNRNAKWRG